MNLELKNKNALVCGSTQGIGKASAKQLAEMGANITLVARNEDKLKTVLLKTGTIKELFISCQGTSTNFRLFNLGWGIVSLLLLIFKIFLSFSITSVDPGVTYNGDTATGKGSRLPLVMSTSTTATAFWLNINK